MSPATPRSREGHLAVDGAELEYRLVPATAAGHPTLVFLHEGLGSVSLWRDFPDALAAATGCGALVYSRAGYGRSSAAALPRPLTYMEDEALQILPRVLDVAGLDDVILVGHSDGASIALVHAGGADAAGRVRALVLEAPHVFCEELSVSSIRRAAHAYAAGDLRARLARHHGENVDVAFRGWNDAWLHPDFMRWNIEAFLAGIRVPVLVVQGRQDEYGTEAQVRSIQAHCGGPVEILMLEDCGHSPHRDQPERTLDVMTRFVAAIASRRLAW